MEHFCILVTDQHVETVREKVRVSQVVPHETFNIALSPTGQQPITHWFCAMKQNDPAVPAILATKELCEMENSNIRDFLTLKNLKVVLKKR